MKGRLKYEQQAAVCFRLLCFVDFNIVGQFVTACSLKDRKKTIAYLSESLYHWAAAKWDGTREPIGMECRAPRAPYRQCKHKRCTCTSVLSSCTLRACSYTQKQAIADIGMASDEVQAKVLMQVCGRTHVRWSMHVHGKKAAYAFGCTSERAQVHVCMGIGRVYDIHDDSAGAGRWVHAHAVKWMWDKNTHVRRCHQNDCQGRIEGNDGEKG